MWENVANVGTRTGFRPNMGTETWVRAAVGGGGRYFGVGSERRRREGARAQLALCDGKGQGVVRCYSGPV